MRTYSQGKHTNIAYPNQHVDTEIPRGSRDHVIVADTIKITFNLDKERSIFNNAGRAIVKEKVLMVGSTKIHTINNIDIYDNYKLLQSIKLENALKA